MSIKKVNGKYRLDIRPYGKYGKRFVRVFDSKSQALQYRNTLLSGKVENQAEQAVFETLRLSELIEKWYDLHGRSLKSSLDTKNRLLKLSASLGNPFADSVTPTSIADYRKNRLDAGISPATINREMITLKAVYREMFRLAVISYESPILKIRKVRETKSELTFLSHSEISRLQVQVDASTNESLPYVVLICLTTGARWSEAEGLQHSRCVNSGFQFVDTKNGHSRFVPVDQQTFDFVRTRLLQGPFRSCYSAFRSAFARSGLKSLPGQMAHILRHTFASHFVMNGGNLVALQKILGHSSLNVTMRYSHLAPDYLKQAVTLNPLAKNNKGGKEGGNKVVTNQKTQKNLLAEKA